ncbi:hypothetical protein [Poseidonocella sedimentorum]|uniref:Uncharacterized protein n=1 Tax=Poseidonocella sedimentorum TaxID=871652 RepID=A0A1I6CW90_9RHOB|nr:hypothetical protein [Poseidonocella sedimentorum]SFQ97410.1 hypothetical protein SAMN04515673_101473 [Poseidonocella sedimentorum]
MTSVTTENGNHAVRAMGNYDPVSAQLAAEELQRLALAALDLVLGQGGAKISPNHNRLRPWFRSAGRIPAQLRAGVQRASRTFPFPDGIGRKPFEDWLLGQSFPPRWRDRARDFGSDVWQHRIRRRPRPEVAAGAEEFQLGLITTALAAPKLRQQVLERIYRYLRARVLMHPDGPPTSAPSAWTLFLLLRAGTMENAPQEIRTCLESLASTVLATEGWAGFWDLWLLDLGHKHPGFDFGEEFASLERKLERWHEFQEMDFGPLAREDWTEDAPEYWRQIVTDMP